MKSLNRVIVWAEDTISRLAPRIWRAHQKRVRKSIWKKKVDLPKARDDRLVQLSHIELGNDYLIGIHSIDAHHRIIALMFNGLVNEIGKFDKNKSTSDDIFHRLSVLISVIGEHFGDEERQMVAHKYPQHLKHKQQHDEFLVDVMMLMDSIEAGDYGVEEFVFFIGSWWAGHILVSDKYFGEFLENQRSSPVVKYET